jgi:hypothetical protein
MRKRILSVVSTLGALPAIALAQPSIPTTGVPTTIDAFYGFACIASNWIFAFVLIIAVIFLLFGAVAFFTARGSEDQVANARRYVTFALVGVAIAVLAKSLIFVVGSFVGADPTGFFDC